MSMHPSFAENNFWETRQLVWIYHNLNHNTTVLPVWGFNQSMICWAYRTNLLFTLVMDFLCIKVDIIYFELVGIWQAES